MAVTVVSSPPVSPAVISASHPVTIEVSSNMYGAANVTQFRFVAETVALLNLGKKFTVVSQLPNRGFFDMSDTFKTLLYLNQEAHPGGTPLPQIATAKQMDD